MLPAFLCLEKSPRYAKASNILNKLQSFPKKCGFLLSLHQFSSNLAGLPYFWVKLSTNQKRSIFWSISAFLKFLRVRICSTNK